MVGGVRSFSVTDTVQVAVLPLLSEAEHVEFPVETLVRVTVVHDAVTVGSQVSVAVAVGVVLPEHFASAVSVIGDGQVTVGGTVSLTVTVVEHEPWLPAASVALHVTGVVPNG